MKMSNESLAGATAESMDGMSVEEAKAGYKVMPEPRDAGPLRPSVKEGIGPTPEQEWELGGFLQRSEGFAR